MLSNLVPFRRVQKYTVVVDHPLSEGTHASSESIENSMEVQTLNVGHALQTLGHKPHGLLAVSKRAEISARAVVRLRNDDAAAALLLMLRGKLCADATVRIMIGEVATLRHDNPLLRAA
ncbi:hypothetical protein SAMN06295974_3746 [Plantibacter flavus]|uniref:Uncharacterized protein n=1 Tax=Plantibacter flavus TaxID=150123 RepID=A0A3N2BLJ3_9MICO|nr:hypothetical protein [Plantibacter flavus]ROR76106.1 hypothetical protein EDD42_4059 [Plantibacter flavus]SMG48512.1 hypothetical protein SAMN06295974_3746 [Plantibacter flavus]